MVLLFELLLLRRPEAVLLRVGIEPRGVPAARVRMLVEDNGTATAVLLVHGVLRRGLIAAAYVSDKMSD